MSPVLLNAQAGSFDTSFNHNGKVVQSVCSGFDAAQAVAVQSDGKIVVACEDYTGSNICVLRYNANGTPDASFGTGGKVTTDFGLIESPKTVTVLSSGKILVGGVMSDGTDPDILVVRYNTNGTLDATFGNGGKVSLDQGMEESVRAMRVAPDGKIVIVSDNSSPQETNTLVVRLNADGSYDQSFNSTGFRIILGGFAGDIPTALAVQPDKKIIVSAERFKTMRFNEDGSFDTSFDGDGILDNFVADGQVCWDIQVDNGKILLAGSVYGGSFGVSYGGLVRLNANGSLDMGFGNNGIIHEDLGPGNGMNGTEYMRLLVQSDHKILAVGSWSSATQMTSLVVNRYTTSGALDNTFDGDGKMMASVGTSWDYCNGAALQPNGKILVVGQTFDGTEYNSFIARFNNDASLNSIPDDIATVKNAGVYPNPVSGGKSVLYYTLNQGTSVSVDVYSEEGKQMTSLKPSAFQAAGTYQLSLETLQQYAPGQYYIRLSTEGQTHVVKVIVK